jgi:PAS domain S-box-containing protein
MKTHDAELRQIKDLLYENPKGMKITRIARALAMNRNATAKFLEILLMTGQVELIEHGMSKIFILSRRTSIPTMLDRSQDFILVLDRNRKIYEANENYLKFSGVSRDEVLGKRPEETNLPVIGRQPVQDRIRQAQYGADSRFELKEVFVGREFFFDIRITPTAFNDGTRGITLIIGDVTLEKKRDQSLRESEAHFRTLFGESPIGTAVFGQSGELVNANPAFLSAFGGQSRTNLAAKNLFVMEGLSPGSRAALDHGEVVKFETGITNAIQKHPEGSVTEEIRLEIQVTPVSLVPGEPRTGYLAQVSSTHPQPAHAGHSFTDENPKLIEEILACIDDAVILLDPGTLSIAFMNPAAGKIFGYLQGEWKGKPVGLLGGDSRIIHGYRDTFSEGLKNGEYIETAMDLHRKGGARFPAQISCRPIFHESGRMQNIVMVVRDITGQDENGVACRQSHNWETQIPVSPRYQPITGNPFFYDGCKN